MKNRGNDFTRLTVALRRNTFPSLDEQNVVFGQIGENNKFVESLKVELDIRLLKVEDAAASANASARSLDRAKLSGTFSTILNGKTGENSLQDGGAVFQDPYSKFPHPMRPEFTQATNEYHIAFKEHQSSLVRLDLAIKAVATVKEVIAIIEKSNDRDRINLKMRSMWKLPREIWGQIFSEAISPGTWISTNTSAASEEWARGTEVLMLSAVCQEWRAVVNGTPLLWSTIHVNPTAHSESALSALIGLHIKRMRSIPCTIVFRVEYSAPIPDGAGSWTKALQNIEELHHLHFQIYPSASPLVTEMCEFLPPPRELTIEAINPGLVPNVSLPHQIGTRLAILSLLFSHVKEPCDATLIRIVFHHDSTETANTVAEWAPVSVQSLERAVLLQSGDTVEPLEARITLPRLRYLETHLTYLTNPFLSTFIVPNLSHLTIASINDRTTQSLREVALQLGEESSLEMLTLKSMYAYDAEVIIGSLGSLSSVTTLELWGDSVDPSLDKLRELMESPVDRDLLRRLAVVVVAEYQGDGHAILASARSISRLNAPLLVQVQVEVTSCSNISRDVHQGLFELYREVAN